MCALLLLGKKKSDCKSKFVKRYSFHEYFQ